MTRVIICSRKSDITVERISFLMSLKIEGAWHTLSAPIPMSPFICFRSNYALILIPKGRLSGSHFAKVLRIACGYSPGCCGKRSKM